MHYIISNIEVQYTLPWGITLFENESYCQFESE